MKRFFMFGLVAIAISLAVNTPVEAKTKAEVSTKVGMQITDRITTQYITPFELVGSAYQGRYQMQSIPGFGSFVYSARSGEITAKDLVKAAIDAKNLPTQAIFDRDYLRHIGWQLRSMVN